MQGAVGFFFFKEKNKKKSKTNCYSFDESLHIILFLRASKG